MATINKRLNDLETELEPLPDDNELVQVVTHGGENGSDVVWMTKRELRARLPRDDVIRITIHHDENS